MEKNMKSVHWKLEILEDITIMDWNPLFIREPYTLNSRPKKWLYHRLWFKKENAFKRI